MFRIDVNEDEDAYRQRFNAISNTLTCCTVIGNVILGLSFVIVVAVILGLSRHEDPNKPIRVWLCVFIGLSVVMSILSAIPPITNVHLARGIGTVSVALQLAGLAWWIVGLYWIISGGEKLMDCAPLLFWMTTVLLGMGVALGAIFCCACSCICCWGSLIACIALKVSDG